MTSQEIINVTPNQQNQSNSGSNTLETAIANVSVEPNIIETSNFQRVLQEIPMRVQEAEQLLIQYRTNPDEFLDAYDEKELDDKIKQLDTVSKFKRDIDNSRKEIKKYLDGKRDEILSVLDKRLEDASFDKLSKAQQDIKQLKSDISADRARNRWDELKVTFEANINRYPLISQFAPSLTDFSRFKILFPSMVSGAKTRKIKESDHTAVNETLYSWNTAIELIKENQWGLSTADMNALLNSFMRTPSIETVNNEGRQLKANADAREKAAKEHEERMRQEALLAQQRELQRQQELAQIQERERIALQERNVQAQQQAEQQRIELERRAKEQAIQEQQRRAEYEQFGGQYKTIFKESFPMFIEYLFTNPKYHNIHSSNQTKAMVVYDIMRQSENPQSIVMRETAGDPSKVLDLVRFILDA